MRLSALLFLFALPIAAQQPAPDTARPTPAYDLVSAVKPNKSGSQRVRIRMDKNEMEAQNVTLALMLSNVYGMRESLIFGLPGWAKSERYDIEAKLLTDDAQFLNHMTRADRREAYLRLLSERFGVKAHLETRIMPVFELTVISSGIKFPENPPPAPGTSAVPPAPGKNGRGNTSVNGTQLSATGVSIGDLCATLSRILDRTVVDKTELKSQYDLELKWSDDRTPSDNGSEESTAPSLFTALQEQLGLKLVSAKGPVSVVVVDQVTPPTEN